jgi:pimeloyl-ACP methyl ester carboxylesterase
LDILLVTLILSKKNKVTTTINAITALGFASILLLLLLPSVLFSNNIQATPTTTSTIVSTRGHFGLSSGNLGPGYSETGYYPHLSEVVPTCPSNREVVVYVHGWLTDERSAISQYYVLKQSLESVGYFEPVIGFSWDSDTMDELNWFDWFDWFDWWDWNWSSLDWREAWDTGKDIAQQNGLKLGKLILDLKTYCENANVRLVGHSLGALVILNAIDSLHNHRELALWNDINRNYRVASVHLLGAAVNPEAVSVRQGFGVPIREEVGQFYNKFSQVDNVLETAYQGTERRVALGEGGAGNMAAGLGNIYHEQEVSREIPIDVNGDRRFTIPPDKANHMGYIGVVNSNGFWINEGVMDIVVLQDW